MQSLSDKQLRELAKKTRRVQNAFDGLFSYEWSYVVNMVVHGSGISMANMANCWLGNRLIVPLPI